MKKNFLNDVEKRMEDDTILPYLDDFTEDANRNSILVGSYPIEKVAEEEKKIEESRLKDAQEIIDRYRRRETNLAKNVQTGKQEVATLYNKLKTNIFAEEKKCAEQQEKRRNSIY